MLVSVEAAKIEFLAEDFVSRINRHLALSAAALRVGVGVRGGQSR